MCLLGRCRSWLRKRGILHLINLIVGFGLYVCDVVFDIYVAVQYARKGEWWWFAFTLAFVMLPLITTNFVHSNIIEGSDILTGIPVSMFIVLINYVRDFHVWKKNYWDNESEHCTEHRERLAKSRLAYVRYLETMSESAPQWCLQNYVMLRQWYFPWYTVLSTVFSFLSLAWSIVSLEKAEKISNWFDENSGRTSYPTKPINTMFFVWQLCSLLSRLSALVFFAYVFRYHVFVFFGLHILLLTIAMHITSQYCDFIRFHSGERLFSRLLAYVGTLYCLTFHVSGSAINIFKYGFKHRGLVLFSYQIVLCLENILLVSLAVWNPPAGTTHNKHLEIIVLCFVFVGLVLSIIFMTLYYECFHPSKTTLVQNSQASINVIDLDGPATASTLLEEGDLMRVDSHQLSRVGSSEAIVVQIIINNS